MAAAMGVMVKPYTSSQKSRPAAPRPAAATHMLARSGSSAPPEGSHLRATRSQASAMTSAQDHAAQVRALTRVLATLRILRGQNLQ